MILLRALFLLGCLALVSACGDDAKRAPSMDAGEDGGPTDGGEGGDGGDVDGGDAGPDYEDVTLKFDAYALGQAGNAAAECVIDITITNIQLGPNGWVGTMSGEAFRAIQVGEDGYEFQALIGGEAFGTFTESGITLDLGGTQLPTDPPFWQGLNGIEGNLDGQYAASGGWSCAPLNINFGIVEDFTVTGSGTWELKVLEE